ncbi:MAG: DUF3298 and DUF4163 domain-containing protein [Patescibacteria group bacterium]
MKKILLAGLCVLAACGAGCAPSKPSVQFTPPTVAPSRTTPPIPQDASATEPTTETPSARYSIETKELKQADKLYDVNVNYPVMSGLADAKIQDTFNRTISLDVASGVKAFVDYFKDVDPVEFAKIWHGDYTLEYTTAEHGRYLSVVLSGDEFTGGAHPMSIYSTYVFDMVDGKFLALKDLFRPGTKYLDSLSAIAYDEISKRNVGEPEWNKTGTAPDEKNFRYFWLDDTGLYLILPPYQVASGAEGEQDVIIPYSKLNQRLAPGIAEGK